MSLLKVKIKNYEFSPGIAATAITLMLIVLFVYLGIWQLGRMETKKTLSSELQARLSEEIIDFSEDTEAMIRRDPESFRFQRMRVVGEFLENKDILLDNQIFEGQAGYHVLSPFLNRDTQTVILVNRGWIPWGPDRNELPEIPSIKGEKELIGIINSLPVALKLAQEDIPSDLWPLRLQQINYEVLGAALQHPIGHFTLQLSEGDPYSFKIKPIYFGLSADRHLGYAVQWFTMALAVVIYYLVISLRHL